MFIIFVINLTLKVVVKTIVKQYLFAPSAYKIIDLSEVSNVQAIFWIEYTLFHNPLRKQSIKTLTLLVQNPQLHYPAKVLRVNITGYIY